MIAVTPGPAPSESFLLLTGLGHRLREMLSAAAKKAGVKTKPLSTIPIFKLFQYPLSEAPICAENHVYVAAPGWLKAKFLTAEEKHEVAGLGSPPLIFGSRCPQAHFPLMEGRYSRPSSLR